MAKRSGRILFCRFTLPYSYALLAVDAIDEGSAGNDTRENLKCVSREAQRLSDLAAELLHVSADVSNINRTALGRRGYRLLEAETLEEGRALLEKENPSLILLDIRLPDGNGLDFCAEVRVKSNIPILFVTALSESEDIVNGFMTGGDDYLPMPYDPKVLQYFVRHEGQIVHAQRLYSEVWSQPMADDDNAVKTIVSRLRERIRPAGFQIESVRGSGYRFAEIDE